MGVFAATQPPAALVPVVGGAISSRRLYSSGKKVGGFFEMTKILGKYAVALGYDWLREIDWKQRMRKMRKVMMQVLPKGSAMPSDQQIKDVLSKPIDPNSPLGRKLTQVLDRKERGNDAEEDELSDEEDHEHAMLIEQSELEDLMFTPTHLAPLSKLETDAKDYPILPDVCFTSTALDPTTDINPHIVQVPQQRTRRPPFQLFMVKTPEIARLMVSRCKAAEYVAIDLEGHANIPTLPRALDFDADWTFMPAVTPVLPADESRGALAVRHAVPVTLESRPHVVKSAFHVPLGDIHAQPWKVHALHRPAQIVKSVFDGRRQLAPLASCGTVRSCPTRPCSIRGRPTSIRTIAHVHDAARAPIIEGSQLFMSDDELAAALQQRFAKDSPLAQKVVASLEQRIRAEQDGDRPKRTLPNVEETALEDLWLSPPHVASLSQVETGAKG
ncbi:hypothetical protein AMAG_18961 [Allomyces macrogynus ATCC 38327]|uniref:Uncharacterized protein n=1 Tax=Allomyces macrogynus (strain ATCC 38327) TaxID=578462 RepID=A0A0L0SLA8_ALLM3|nr:hypothetical protein AMAG_18961 [Allomyces macrogynus ATCC 38327]|eukprot:KNE63170.1 hypothetical protein AMAG_18961 [Allomyces macrogynus ATCC 38327]